MCKRAMLILLALIMVPSFTSAATYWQITATTSPTALKTNLTAARPANFGNYTTPGGAAMTLTKVTRTPYNTVGFDVATVPGYTVKVKVDGVQVGTTPGTYNVAKGTLLNHTIVAAYTAVSSQYALTTLAAGGGSISPSASYVSNGTVTVTPYTGYVLTGLKIGAVTYLLADTLPGGISRSGDGSGATYTFASGSYTLQGVFAAVPKATAVISTPNLTVDTGATGIIIDGSTSTSNVPGTTYVWFAGCGTLVPDVDNPKMATFTAADYAVSCFINLTVNAPGIVPPPTTKITVTAVPKVWGETAMCLDCHNGSDGPAVPGAPFSDNAHYYKASCSNCHNADNTSSHAYNTAPVIANACVVCHNQNSQVTEFKNSKHWDNHLELGPEFADPRTGINGILNANESYTTTEFGTVVTCAYRCHFKPGSGPFQNVGTVLADGKATGYIKYTDTLGSYGPAGTVYSRPGGDACMACHDAHGPAANAQSTCYTCHSGSNHGWSVKAFEKSTHFTGDAAKTYYQMDKNSCTACHNAHSTEATYDGCNNCHTPGSPYGIYNADMTGKAPHFQTGTPDAGGFYPTGSYITAGGATCASCHYHNNSVNADWAESGHGSLTAVPWKSDASHNWNAQGTDGVNYTQSPQKTNCIRCHSSRGFAQYWDSGFSNIDKVYLDPVAKTLDKASAPLTCDGCHSGSKGVRGAVRPMPAGFTKVKSFYGYSNTTFAPAKMLTNLEFTDNKNSNICLPCHSQRAAGTGIKALFAQGSFKQYSVGTSMYPHEAQPAAIVDGKGGYEFSGTSFAYQDRMRHIRIGNYGTGTGYNNTGITQGNCGGCHMTSDKTHSLEVLSKDVNGTFTGIVSNTCVKCHPAAFTYQDIQKKKAEFDAAVTVLGQLLINRGFTQDGINVLAERKAFDMSRNYLGVRTKDNAIAEKNMGAWFNWYLFKTADKAGYAHNPAYSRRLIEDSINWLDDNNLSNDSSAPTIAKLAVDNPSVVTAAVKADALAQLNNPGCMGCHFGTGSTANGEVVPGIEQAPHYNTAGTLVPGQTFTQAQFVVAGAQCNNCHGYGHGTDSPGGTIITEYAESAHGDINGLAWSDYDFKNRQGCVQCHTTTGFVKNVGMSFAAGTPSPSIDAFGDPLDTTKQVLGCNTCHSSTAWKTSVRNGGAVTAPMGVSGNTPKAVISYADVGESNVCIMCHASRENGESLIAGNPTNTTTKGFTNPHYLGAAAVFYGKGGFQFYTSGVRYNTYGAAGKTGKTANWSHGRLGMDNYITTTNATVIASGAIIDSGNKGQCVACHLGPANTHTFGAAEVANATKGTSTYTRNCYGCHTNTDPNAAAVTIEQFIDEEKEIWYRMFDFYKWQLAQYGITYTDAYPYFAGSFGATVGTTFGGPGVIDNNKTRGAAMNLKLLLAEKGSHVHNRSFGRALIADSITYLQKGDVGNRSIVYPDQNQIIKFSDYSTARPTSYPGQVGPDISITTLKSYLTRTATGGYTRR